MPAIPESTEERLALALCWSVSMPDRIGEILLLPPAQSGLGVTLGRGASGNLDGCADLTQQRPGLNLPRPTLADAHVSKRQLTLSATADGIAYENIGRCALVANGVSATAGLAKPGDTLYLDRASLWLVIRRPAVLPRFPSLPKKASASFGQPDDDGLIGESLALWTLRHQIVSVAGERAHVLVTGASGTERERIAMALHRHCGKSVRSFVSRDAATVGSGLRQADGSTLFVDEIGAVSADARVEIFRALDTGEYQAIGETELRKADVRLIGATADRDALQSGWLDRLKLSVHAPGLGDRLEDIPLLMRDLLGERFHAVDPRLVDALIRHRFTDHIRELDRLTKLAVATSTGAEVALTTEVRAELQL